MFNDVMAYDMAIRFSGAFAGVRTGHNSLRFVEVRFATAHQRLSAAARTGDNRLSCDEVRCAAPPLLRVARARAGARVGCAAE